MAKLIWMSDPHFTAEGDVLGHDPRVRLKAAVAHINDHHADAQLCVISGDMVNRGGRADYENLRDELSRLAMPYLPMPGNHDDRALFRDVLPLSGTCMADFIQFTAVVGDSLIVCLDTQDAGADSGFLCDERLRWLDQVLNETSNKSVYIFMHHPPMPLGLPMQDKDSLRNGDQFLDLVAWRDCLKYLFIGHVHRPISGSIRGVPFSTMRSVLYQAPAPAPAWDWTSFSPGQEAPNIGVLNLSKGSVVLQYDQFCKFEVGVARH